MPVNWKSKDIAILVELGLSEDRIREDVTTLTLVPGNVTVKACIRAKQAGIVAGLPMAALFFRRIDPKIRFLPRCKEGAIVRKGHVMALISGRARSILQGERPALNAIQHLSGIASYSYQQVKNLASKRTALFDTRKTLPGWRLLEKYAVRCGGAQNHRMSLGDAILVKENHLLICRRLGVKWRSALQALHARRPHLPMQIEIQDWYDLREAATLFPQRVLLDNLPIAKLRAMIAFIRKHLPKTEIEISGGVRPSDLFHLRRLEVERISMGRLTHSAPAFDCSLDILRVNSR